MPNYVKNKLEASRSVLDAMAKGDEAVSLEAVIPFPEGLFMGNDSGGINTLAEDCAEKAFNQPINDHPLIARLQTANRAKWSANDLTDSGFEDFIGMCRSKKQTGFYSILDFCKSEWGTKWGAMRASRTDDAVTFETAWSTPMPIWEKLSKTYPNETLCITYADEDLGRNCGTIILQNGAVISQHDGDLTFAHDVWGHTEEYRAELAAEWAEES